MNRSYYNGRRTMSASHAAYPSCACNAAAAASNHQAECDDMVLAMSYMLMQDFTDLYEPEAGFPRGTVFAQLDKPFLAGGMGCE